MPRPLTFSDALSTAKDLADEWRTTAARRDREGGTAKYERDQIRASGLLTFFIAQEFGGSGGSFTELMAIFREMARADSSLAHLFAFHHYQLVTVQLFGTPEQYRRLHHATVAEGWFWGNGINTLNNDVTATRTTEGYEWNGIKTFATGSKDSDYLTISGRGGDGRMLVAAIPTTRKGIVIRGDWNNIGQRQTDSGAVEFNHVAVANSEILPHVSQTPRASLRNLVGQTVFGNLFWAVAQGALDEAVAYLRGKETIAWSASLAPTQQKDPFILRTIGELHTQLEAVRLLSDRANTALEQTLAKGEAVTWDDRAKVAVAAFTARAAATQTGLQVSSRIFEFLGARATTSALAFDRFWRNIRTQTLHDPIDYKTLAIGDYVLNGELPPPGFFG
ncbi:MAG: acyl-CoA dehydrogenase family protein [Azoarcus sp.]|jgi:alkylation response protein AidB-like acyl-CoA dehydrogenase|nr:acyl-CoA dehydrogenase family protein [Azoarcus sp.]